MNLISRIAGAARLLATGKLAPSTGFDGAQMQRRLMAWRAGSESINRLILQGGELQRARARQLVRSNPYASNACASFTAHAVGCGIKPSSLVDAPALKDRIQRLWLAWTDEADADGLNDFYGLQAMAARHVRGRRVLLPLPVAPPGGAGRDPGLRATGPRGAGARPARIRATRSRGRPSSTLHRRVPCRRRLCAARARSPRTAARSR